MLSNSLREREREIGSEARRGVREREKLLARRNHAAFIVPVLVFGGKIQANKSLLYRFALDPGEQVHVIVIMLWIGRIGYRL